MPDNKQRDFNKDQGMKPDSDKGQQHNAPGRGTGDDLATGKRQGQQGGFDREDREKEQPGSKQRDRQQNY
jgi:hypothetical protein